jgi:hypothetical protein
MKRKFYMPFNTHSELEGKHAFLSASNYHWVNYSDDKLDRVFTAAMAAAQGDRLHKLAHDLIKNRVKLPEEPETTLSMYVNDAIGFRMKPEVMLVYSRNAFGTADCISFRQEKLRISDLKTGVHPASVTQLEVYAALFCLEYRESPFDMEIYLTIYQNNERREYIGDPDTIFRIMDRFKVFDARIEEMRKELDA